MPNQTQSSNDKKYDLEERTQVFGELIIDFVKTLPKNSITIPLVNQIVRSGTSVGANYMEADGAESKKDFVHKIGICKKESKETLHWLHMIAEAVPETKEKSDVLYKEIQELTLIFGKILSTLRKNEGAG